MRLDEAGITPSQLLAVQRDINERLEGSEGLLWLDRYKLTNRGENPYAELTGKSKPLDTWKDEIVSVARRKLKRFFGRHVQVDPIPASVTSEVALQLLKYNMKLVFWPDADINEAFEPRGYIKPNAYFYTNVANGNIKGDAPTRLRRGWYGVDFTVGANITDGTQIMEGDPWTILIERLRREKRVEKKDETTPLGSRFYITPIEWEEVVLSYMASALSIARAQVRMERAIEYNLIANLYDHNRGKFNMWEWFHEIYGDTSQLCGGDQVLGGVSCVSKDERDRRFGVIARPLVSFSP